MSATTQKMKITDVHGQLNALVTRVYEGETRIIVERDGIPVAALVSPEDLELIDETVRERARQERFAILDEMQAAFADVSEEEIERETAKALAEVRAEMRAEREQASVTS
jgi:prevent-host-death family protein